LKKYCHRELFTLTFETAEGFSSLKAFYTFVLNSFRNDYQANIDQEPLAKGKHRLGFERRC